MTSPKIAYVLSRFPYLPETFTLREILELQRIGWDVELFAIQHQHDAVRHPEAARLEATAHYLEPLSRSTLAANVRLLRKSPAAYAELVQMVVAGNWGSLDFLLKGTAILPGAIELAERMDRLGVQHVHAQYATHAALLAMIAARILGVGFSFTVHAHDVFVNATMFTDKVRAASFIAAISNFNRELIGVLTGPAGAAKTAVIRCGVNLAEYEFRPRSNRHGDEPLKILAVGSLQEYKGHEYLVRACAALASGESDAPHLDFVCEIVGGGALRPRLQRLANELGVSDRVHFLGPRDQHGVAAAMHEADVLVLPSVVAANGQMEGIPVVLMEAMASGLPVIASALSGIPELVIDQETGLLVPPGDPNAIADALIEVVRDPAAAQRRALAGRELVEREVDLAKNVAKLSSQFQAILDQPTSRAEAEAA